MREGLRRNGRISRLGAASLERSRDFSNDLRMSLLQLRYLKYVSTILWPFGETRLELGQSLETGGLRSASSTYRKAMPNGTYETKWCCIKQPKRTLVMASSLSGYLEKKWNSSNRLWIIQAKMSCSRTSVEFL